MPKRIATKKPKLSAEDAAKAERRRERHREHQKRYIATHPVVYDDRRRKTTREAVARYRARQKAAREKGDAMK